MSIERPLQAGSGKVWGSFFEVGCAMTRSLRARVWFSLTMPFLPFALKPSIPCAHGPARPVHRSCELQTHQRPCDIALPSHTLLTKDNISLFRVFQFAPERRDLFITREELWFQAPSPGAELIWNSDGPGLSNKAFFSG